MSLTYVLCSRGRCDFLLVPVDMAAGQIVGGNMASKEGGSSKAIVPSRIFSI